MFAWLKKWFVREERYDTYKPSERYIYHYWNGTSNVAADPVALYKKMMAVGPELSIDLKVAASPSKDAGLAHDKVLSKIRDIFSVPANGDCATTLTQIELADLLDHFLIYCETVKKKQKKSVTVQNISSAGSAADAQPICNSLESGSTDKEPTCESPMPSPLESASL